MFIFFLVDLMGLCVLPTNPLSLLHVWITPVAAPAWIVLGSHEPRIHTILVHESLVFFLECAKRLFQFQILFSILLDNHFSLMSLTYFPTLWKLMLFLTLALNNVFGQCMLFITLHDFPILLSHVILSDVHVRMHDYMLSLLIRIGYLYPAWLKPRYRC